MFYLHDQLTMVKGESVEGVIKCKPNSSNHRDLDFTISYDFEGQTDGKQAGTHEYRMR